MRRNRIHEVPMGSTADIAFLLLIFFLVATTIDSDIGIIRKLPPFDGSTTSTPRKERNILIVLVNRDNQLMVEGEVMDIIDLRETAREFIRNENGDPELPELYPEQVEFLGEVPITKKHVISLQSDRGTSYEMYIAVQNELQAAYRELRDEMSMERFGKAFKDLPSGGEMAERKAIEYIYPMNISEAEPVF